MGVTAGSSVTPFCARGPAKSQGNVPRARVWGRRGPVRHCSWAGRAAGAGGAPRAGLCLGQLGHEAPQPPGEPGHGLCAPSRHSEEPPGCLCGRTGPCRAMPSPFAAISGLTGHPPVHPSPLYWAQHPGVCPRAGQRGRILPPAAAALCPGAAQAAGATQLPPPTGPRCLRLTWPPKPLGCPQWIWPPGPQPLAAAMLCEGGAAGRGVPGVLSPTTVPSVSPGMSSSPLAGDAPSQRKGMRALPVPRGAAACECCPRGAPGPGRFHRGTEAAGPRRAVLGAPPWRQTQRAQRAEPWGHPDPGA